MLFTKSAGAVIFYRLPECQIEYLLLNHGNEWERNIEYWNFPKGTIEKGETEIQTAQREIEEETGLVNLKFYTEFREAERYFCRVTKSENKRKLIFKTAVFYLAQAENKNIKISSEHVGYEWLSFEEAFARVKRFKGSQKILSRADKFLHEYLAKNIKNGDKIKKSKNV